MAIKSLPPYPSIKKLNRNGPFPSLTVMVPFRTSMQRVSVPTTAEPLG